MIQDLFVLSLDERGEGFERAVVRAILMPDALPPTGGGRWAYPDGSSGEVHGLDDAAARSRAAHLMFTRFGGATMLARIFEIAETLEVVLFWPGPRSAGPNACVTRAERLGKIGSALRTVLTVVVVRDVAHLEELMDGAASPV